MRNLGFYTTAYLNTRLDMHEKAVAERLEKQESLEERLLKLQDQKAKLVRELNKMREIGSIMTGQESALKNTQQMMNETQVTNKPVSAGGKGGAGSKVNLYLDLKTPQDYQQIQQNFESMGFSTPEEGRALTDSMIASAHSQRVLEAIGEGKFDQAYQQMQKMVPEMMRVVPADRRQAVMDIMNEHLVNTAPGLMIDDTGNFLNAEAAAAFQTTTEEAKPGVRAAARQEALRATQRFTQGQEAIEKQSSTVRSKLYDPRIYEMLDAGIEKISQDAAATEAELQNLRDTRLELDLGPGYRPFAPMFANIRAQRAQLRAMRGMSPEDKQVYGLTYDYLKNNRSFAEDSNAMRIASMMNPANSAELLTMARDKAKDGVASVDDIIQAYIQIKQAASQGQASVATLAADAATEEVASNLQASATEQGALLRALEGAGTVNLMPESRSLATFPEEGVVRQERPLVDEPEPVSTKGNFREAPSPNDQQFVVLRDDYSNTYRDAETGEIYQVRRR